MIRELSIRLSLFLLSLFVLSFVCFALFQLPKSTLLISSFSKYSNRILLDSSSVSLKTDLPALLSKKESPFTTRYLEFLQGALRGDLGNSYFNQAPVSQLLLHHFPLTLAFLCLSFLLSCLGAIPIGLFLALKVDSGVERFASALLVCLYSLPSFTVSLIFILAFASYHFPLFPLGGITTENFELLNWQQKILDYMTHATLPLLSYTMTGFSLLTLLVRNKAVEELGRPYVLTARSKGLSTYTLLYKHVLRNLLPSLLNYFCHWLTVFFFASLVVESLFSLSGAGKLSVESVVRRDYPVIMGVILVLAVIQLSANLLRDLLSVTLDPRLRSRT